MTMRLFSTTAHRRQPDTLLTAEYLYQHYLTPVYRFVYRRVPRQADAEDITAETFAAAFGSMGRLQHSRDPYVYLLGIARRKCIDHARRRQRHPEPESLDETVADATPDPLQRTLRGERHQELWRVLESLSPDQREALLLQHLEDLSVAQIARVLGKSVGATNSLLQRARAGVLARGGAYFLGEETYE